MNVLKAAFKQMEAQQKELPYNQNKGKNQDECTEGCL